MSHCCFNLHFPEDIFGASFRSLLAMCISFLLRHLFRSLAHFHLFIYLFIGVAVEFSESLCISDTSLLSEACVV